ncbi:EamA family transporter [Desulfovibrio sp. OttesenSCG-928-C14]|nr:EamA family transporter [Desulfovibrio sp. OttesenSCG-928-C14]
MDNVLAHLYILATIICGVSSQVIMRWQVLQKGQAPLELAGKLFFVGKLLLSPWVILAMLLTFIGGITWMLAINKFPLSYAYPWISLTYILVMGLSICLFNETLSPYKVFGTILVIAGLIITTRG